jgi:hypothetical protein
VQGFLDQDACFIATASYGSLDAAPVRLLRAFRDRVLKRFDAGRAFVGWYYSWSPHAAAWLEERPHFRGAALLALTPFEAVAWLALNPVAVLAWALVALAMVAFRRKSGLG